MSWNRRLAVICYNDYSSTDPDCNEGYLSQAEAEGVRYVDNEIGRAYGKSSQGSTEVTLCRLNMH